MKLSWQFPALGEPIYLRWHDGNSYDAGGLSSGGAFYAGARWYADDLKDYEELSLTDVEFYINQYDRGPANSGRGNLYSNDGVTWGLLNDSETGIDANWNISIGLSAYSNVPLEPAKAMSKTRKTFAPKASPAGSKLVAVPVGVEATSQKNAFMGYNVYRNRERLNTETVTETTYIDDTPIDNKYLEYQVSAIYSVSGEKYSAPVTLTATGINGVESGNGLRVEADDDEIKVYGLKPGTAVTLYDVNGAVLYSGKSADTYVHVIPAAAIADGTYIVKAGNDAVKFD